MSKEHDGIDRVVYETALEKLRSRRKETLLFSDEQLRSVENSEKYYIGYVP